MNVPLSAVSAQTSATLSRQSDAQLNGPILAVARASWIVVALFIVGLSVVAIPVEFSHVREVCGDTSVCGLNAEQARTFQSIGITPIGYAFYVLALNGVFTLAYSAIALLLFWRKSTERVALLSAFTLLTFGGATFPNTLATLAQFNTIWRWPVAGLSFLGGATITLFLYLLPSGRFVPRWAAVPAISWIIGQGGHYFLPRTGGASTTCQ